MWNPLIIRGPVRSPASTSAAIGASSAKALRFLHGGDAVGCGQHQARLFGVSVEVHVGQPRNQIPASTIENGSANRDVDFRGGADVYDSAVGDDDDSVVSLPMGMAVTLTMADVPSPPVWLGGR
ncbi:MAG: hypothetical protein GY708_19660 [Actinomycetia bacterium]|nr:hypothetical protein [Actinomycetes bacterium]